MDTLHLLHHGVQGESAPAKGAQHGEHEPGQVPAGNLPVPRLMPDGDAVVIIGDMDGGLALWARQLAAQQGAVGDELLLVGVARVRAVQVLYEGVVGKGGCNRNNFV